MKQLERFEKTLNDELDTVEEAIYHDGPGRYCRIHGEELQELWPGRLDCESCLFENARESQWDR